MTPQQRLLMLAAPPLAAAALVVAWALGRPRLDLPALGLAAGLGLLMLLADVRPVRIGPAQKMSLAAVPALVAALTLAAPLAATAAALAALASNRWLKRRLRNALYNASVIGVAVLAAGFLGRLSGETSALVMVRAVAGAAVFALLTIGLAALAAAAQRQAAPAPLLARAYADSWTQAAAMGAVAIASAFLLLHAPPAAVLPLAILPLVYRSNRLIEAELESKERMARLLAAQRRFLTDVSHNVGNPLSTIRANLSLIGHAPLRSAEREALADAGAESLRLSELFRRLRVLAETDEDVPMHLSDLDLSQLAGDLIRAYTTQASARGVELRMETEARPAVQADEDLLRQAAANLVENAIRYSPDGGAVVIRVTAEPRQARLEVIDQGPGIDPRRLPAIFNRFETGPGGGSGLGLAIARNVVERHGGRIEVDSQLGGGSRFAILLPAP